MQSLFINYVQIFTVGNKLLSIKNITTWTIPHYIKQMNVKVVHINKTIITTPRRIHTYHQSTLS